MAVDAVVLLCAWLTAAALAGLVCGQVIARADVEELGSVAPRAVDRTVHRDRMNGGIGGGGRSRLSAGWPEAGHRPCQRLLRQPDLGAVDITSDGDPRRGSAEQAERASRPPAPQSQRAVVPLTTQDTVPTGRRHLSVGAGFPLRRGYEPKTQSEPTRPTSGPTGCPDRCASAPPSSPTPAMRSSSPSPPEAATTSSPALRPGASLTSPPFQRCKTTSPMRQPQ